MIFMALAKYNGSVLDAAGNLVIAPTVEVRRMAAGMPLVPIFSDRDGLVQMSNPFTASNGDIGFHVAGGVYQIRVTAAALPGGEKILQWVPVGTLAEMDLGESGLLAFEWDAVVSLLEDRDTFDDQIKGFSVLVESDEDHDNLPTVYYKQSESSGDWSSGLIFPAIRLKAGPTFRLYANGDAIQTGIAHDQPVTFPCAILGWRMTSRGTGSIVIDLKKGSFASWPSGMSSVCGGNPPTIAAGDKAEDFVLSAWDTSLNEGEQLALDVVSNDALTDVTLSLFLRRL